ncbi:MAG: DUF4870 domain-containing protein [Chloroflexota bacterium]|nr:DUF4870 domain-containing protein [Dehalococcoidia bacterium]MDW8253544.1 DUF4870 domain-containing protein [Chloroflexota bacterium]
MQSEAISPNDRLWAILSYIFTPIVGIIVLLLEDYKNRPFARYHAVQSIGFGIAIIAYFFLFTIVYTILTAITFGILGLCLWIFYFAPLIPMIYYAYQASQNRYFEIPALTNFMVQQGWLTRPPAASV